MSVVFVVAPAVVAGWPVMCAAVAGAAAALGYKVLDASAASMQAEKQESEVEVAIQGSEILAENMKYESEFIIKKDDVVARFRKTGDGRCTVHVSAQNRSEAELEAIGRELVGKVTQQYAYNKVVSQLKRQGFTVTDEELTADKTIRIHVSKYV